MATKSQILSDNGRLSRADKFLLFIEIRLALISGIAVLGLILMAVVSVGGRNFFNAPLPGYVDWIEQIMPLIAFMGIAYIQREGAHIRMDMLIGRLRGRALYATELFTTVIVLGLMILLLWGSWAHFSRSFDITAPMWSRDSSMDIALPIWPAKLLIPISFAVLCLRLCLQIWAYIAAIITGKPIGVPLPISVAEHAAMEAQIMDQQEKPNGTH